LTNSATQSYTIQYHGYYHNTTHLVTPSSQTTPLLCKEIPRANAFYAELWLTVRLHPNHRLLDTGRLIRRTIKAHYRLCFDGFGPSAVCTGRHVDAEGSKVFNCILLAFFLFPEGLLHARASVFPSALCNSSSRQRQYHCFRRRQSEHGPCNRHLSIMRRWLAARNVWSHAGVL
jgi:hypothetical protein